VLRNAGRYRRKRVAVIKEERDVVVVDAVVDVVVVEEEGTGGFAMLASPCEFIRRGYIYTKPRDDPQSTTTKYLLRQRQLL